MRSSACRRSRERGATLVVGLVMLVLVTLMVLASFRLGYINLGIVGNQQSRTEGIGSAQEAIEEAINSPLLTTSPAAIFPVPCTDANTRCYDFNEDGKNDVEVRLTPTPACIKAETIKNSSLDLSQEDDRRCTLGIPQTFGMPGGGSSNSLCSNSVWDIRAEAQDLTTGSTSVVNEGVGVRVRTADVATSCP